METKWFDVEGQVYRVAQEGGHVFLHGVRGACYALVPYASSPTCYHVVNRTGRAPRQFSRLVFKIQDSKLVLA